MGETVFRCALGCLEKGDCNFMDNDYISYEPADIIIYIQGRGIVLKEKSLIAFRKNDDKIVACGTEAERLAGREGKDMEDIVVMSPLRQGMAAEFPEARALFSYLLGKALGKKPTARRPILGRPTAVCVPKGITSVEKKAVEEILIDAGAGEVLISDIPAEEFIRQLPEHPKLYHRLKIIVGIAKEEPERYIKERLRGILEYAEQEKISQERIYALLQEMEQHFRIPLE